MTSPLDKGIDAHIFTAATLRLARHLCFLYSEEREGVTLATACALGALQAGSVCFDLEHPELLHQHQDVEMTWPQVDEWREELLSSPMVATSPVSTPGGLVMESTLIYVRRYWQAQESIAQWITRRSSSPSMTPTPGVELFFSGKFLPQREAGIIATQTRFCVLAGGPGTGKTTTVARILAAITHEQGSKQRVILCAPTGRAAARLEQAVRENLEACQELGGCAIHCESGTIHRILGLNFWGSLAHTALNPIPADIIVVDEASMLSLHMMTLLLAATSESTRLILVGDPDQLTSVDAGAVLADIASEDTVTPVARLSTTFRFSGAIASLAEAIRRGQTDIALHILATNGDTIEWVDDDSDFRYGQASTLESLRDDILAQQRDLITFCEQGDIAAGLASLDSHRLLLAHRHGPFGVNRWTLEVRQWLSDSFSRSTFFSPWYVGMPMLVTRNDEIINVYNGDSGVVVSDNQEPSLAVGDSRNFHKVSLAMIPSSEPLYCSTIHKAQGSQFGTVSVLLGASSSTFLSRELLYTAVTRARKRLRIIGSAETLSRAINSPALRASGLAEKLRRHQDEEAH
ncbi:MAG: exodeoxyribonuclease V subunit alpha [Propionibacteriaceae bacterium]|nr:exodeoxyribonuclease V subunit alpha [Propionibacteriaceae bacterium]